MDQSTGRQQLPRSCRKITPPAAKCCREAVLKQPAASFLTMAVVLVVLLTVPCAVFAVSSWSKLRGLAAFEASLGAMRLVPTRFVRPVAAAVCGSEAVVAVGLLVGLWHRGVALVALAAAGLLLAVLTAAVVIVLRRGTVARCACFGGSGQRLRRAHVVRNGLLLLVMAAAAALVARGTDTAGAAGPPATALGAFAGGVGALLLTRLDELVDLFAPERVTSNPRS